MTAYYNEIDPFAAQWLRNLISAGHIAPGDVDERSITDVRPDELRGYTQCHFFAGIGVWSYALRLAGWPDDRPVWTGSCPCQPFSGAGKGGGFADERHLWPAWHWLVRQRKPPVIFGEQVASKDGLGWLDLVSADLEAEGYAGEAVDICAAGVGAPHIRQRIYFAAERLADANSVGRARVCGGGETGTSEYRETGWVEDSERLSTWRNSRTSAAQEGGAFLRAERDDFGPSGAARRLADAASFGCGEEHQNLGGVAERNRAQRIAPGHGTGRSDQRSGPTNGFWRDPDWLFCRDGKWRPVEPGTSPLAHGSPARVGRLRAYGNSINAEDGAVFIEAWLESRA